MKSELKLLRSNCLKLSFEGKDGNLQSCFSSIEILWTLYKKIMNWDTSIANLPERDIFVLSKGQSTLALHIVLSHLGLFSFDELKTFCQYHSRFSMQADRTKFPEGGIEVSAGSLGHGFPIATGMALARKIKKSSSRVYVLAGDGEMNEGTMWEACIFAASHHLDNLCLIIDNNHSLDDMLNIGNLENKLSAFGFVTAQCNGHKIEEIEFCIQRAMKKALENKTPACVIANTVRGYGSLTLMSDKSWFHRYPNKKELEQLLQEVIDFA